MPVKVQCQCGVLSDEIQSISYLIKGWSYKTIKNKLAVETSFLCPKCTIKEMPNEKSV